MKKNEDRIWDVLIEDALRRSSTSRRPEALDGREQPFDQTPPGDHTRRLLRPIGPLGVDRGRSMRRGGRRSWLPAAAVVAGLVLVAVILYGGAVWLPKPSEDNHQPQAADNSNKKPLPPTSDAPEHPNPGKEPDNPPADEPEPAPEPRPEPQPESESKSVPTPNQEQPQPKPIKPAREVEPPKPEPAPEPSPAKPDDVVEQPKQPEGTAAPPDTGPTIHVLSVSKGARLELSTDAERKYAPADDRNELPNGVWLTCRQPVDLLAGGVLLRLKGELHVEITDGALELRLDDDDLYMDNRGANRSVTLVVKDHSLAVSSGATLVEDGAGGVSVTVFDGEAHLQDDVIPAGRRGVLKKRGLVGLHEPRDSMKDTPFLKGLADRVVYRENFDADPKGRLQEGELAQGLVTGHSVFWGYPRNIAFEPGLVIRLRVRLTNTTRATLTQFCEERNDNYSVDLKELKQDEWFVLEARIDEFLERTNHEGHPQVGESFMNVSLELEDENAQVELDWIELIRAVK